MYFILFREFRQLLRRNFFRLALLVAIVVTYGTFSEYLLEKGATGSGVKSIFDSLWFTMQTITTVGYGDTPVVSFWGRVNAIFLMLVGIGVLGFFSASFATRLIEYSSARSRGEHRTHLTRHVVLCNWNPIADELVHELLMEDARVVLLAQVEKSPQEGLEFVRGTCLHISDLLKAGTKDAESLIVLAETITDGELASAVDAKTVLGIMNARKINQNAHIVAELLRAESEENAKMAVANEVVIRGQVSAKLLSRGTLDPGTIDIMNMILSARSGEEVFEEKLPDRFRGKTYREIVNFLLEKNATTIALRGPEGLKVNPGADTVLDHDSVVYISKERLGLK